jgi:ParB/RepB/Spo0J family partition protein
MTTCMPTKNIERFQIIPRYAHTRMARTRELNAMVASMRRFGQISPVLVTKEEPGFVLIDGYLRLQAVRMLGMDVLRADVREESEADMLAMVLSKSQERQWECVEQGFLIRDLTSRFEWSMAQVARRLGRDPSWISRRLALVNDLPEEVLDALCKGHLSTWAAGRVLAPLARANRDHAVRLTNALVEQPLSARDLNVIWQHYAKSNAKVREQLVDNPHLFIKAHKAQTEKEQGLALAKGPEGEWGKDLHTICCILKRLKRNAGIVLYGGEEQRKPHLHALEQARETFDELQTTVREVIDGQARTTHGGTGNAQGRDVDSRDRTQAEHLAQHRTQHPQGQGAGAEAESVSGPFGQNQGADSPHSGQSGPSPGTLA